MPATEIESLRRLKRRALKGANTKRATDPDHFHKLAAERESKKSPEERSANSAKGWANSTPEQRAEREAKRQETRRKNRNHK